MALAATGPADLRDQRWLDERIATSRNGIEAVIDIALNWTEGRNVGRLHPGVAAADYVRESVGLIGREAIVPLLTESNWSNRQIAAVAGVDESTIRRTAANAAVDRPAKTLGADGRLRTPTPVRTSFRPRLAPDAVYTSAPRPAPTPVAPASAQEPEEPIDTASWSALGSVIDAIETLAGSDAAYVAAAVPERRRAATAKRLRKLGTYLGRIAWTLEGQESSPS